MHVDGRDIEKPIELALKFDADAATWTIAGDAEEYRLGKARLKIRRVLEHAGEPLGPKEIAEMAEAKHGATRELLSQMVKDGQVRNFERAPTPFPSVRTSLTSLTSLTNEGGNVRLSGMSGHFRKEDQALFADAVT